MQSLKSGWFGVVLGGGVAFAIVAYNDDNPVFAAVVAVITIAATALTWWNVDRLSSARERDEL